MGLRTAPKQEGEEGASNSQQKSFTLGPCTYENLKNKSSEVNGHILVFWRKEGKKADTTLCPFIKEKRESKVHSKGVLVHQILMPDFSLQGSIFTSNKGLATPEGSSANCIF